MVGEPAWRMCDAPDAPAASVPVATTSAVDAPETSIARSTALSQSA